MYLLSVTYRGPRYTVWTGLSNMSRVVRKPAFCICENKDEDQLRGNREADQRLCFRYTDSTIPLLPKTGFLTTRLICLHCLQELPEIMTI